jgi:hypothetical protein
MYWCQEYDEFHLTPFIHGLVKTVIGDLHSAMNADLGTMILRASLVVSMLIFLLQFFSNYLIFQGGQKEELCDQIAKNFT